jgi:hypothetical protein
MAERWVSSKVLLAIVLGAVVGVVVGWAGAPKGATADHSFVNQTWDDCGPVGCIGWKQFAELGISVGVAHMDNGGSYCGTSLDVSWANAVVYWNSEGTVASFSFPVSNCNPQSYPTVRIIPYTQYNPSAFWIAMVLNFDQDPSTGAFEQPYCLAYCDNGENGANGAQHGYDLSYVYFNTSKSPASWEWVARHEIGHVVGLADHHLEPYGCNPNYYGLMDDAGCDTSYLTSAEWYGVNDVHDQ